MKHNPVSVGFKISYFAFAVFFIFITVFSFLVAPSKSDAAINQQINYQGKLTDSSSVTVTDGTYAMEFDLYTVSSGGSPIWTEAHTGGNKVQVTNGLFSVMLGAVTPFTGVNFNQTLYLGVTIGADAEMTPRKILGSVPASIEAFNLGGASSTQYVRADQAGIISTSTSSTLFRLNQTGSGNFFDITNGSTNYFNVLNNGNVGIGSSTPGYLLSVAGTSRFTGASLFDSTLGVTGQTTLANASSTNFSVTGNSFLGTVKSGTWNGTAIGPTFGGTGLTSYAAGDLIYASSVNTLSKRSIGSNGNVLAVSFTGLPVWTSTLPSLDIDTLTIDSSISGAGFTNSLNGLAPILLGNGNSSTLNSDVAVGYNNTASGVNFLTFDYPAAAIGSFNDVEAINSGGAGTIGVGMGNSVLGPNTGAVGISNSVDNSGGDGDSFAIGLSQIITTDHTVSIGNGVNSLVLNSDGLSLSTGTYIGNGSTLTSLSGTNITLGIVAPTVGGTGLTSYTTGDLIYGSASNVLSKRAIGSTGNVLSVVGGLPSWVATSTLGLGGGGGSGTVNSGLAGYFGYYPSNGTTIDDQSVLYTNGTNIGIGTTTPLRNLEILASQPIIRLADNRNLTGTNWAGTEIGNIEFFSTDPTSNGTKITGAIKSVGSNDSGAGTLGGDLTFSTNPGNTQTLNEALRITSNGQVAIGTTSPQSIFLFSVAGTSNFTGAVGFNGSAGASGTVLQSNGSSAAPSWVATSTLGISGGAGAVSSVSNSDGTLTISPTTGAVVASLALGHANNWTSIQTFSNSTYSALFTGGNVGIGTTTPIGKLTVTSDGSVNNQFLRMEDTASGGKTFSLVNHLNSTAGTFSIYDATAAASRLAIDTNGNVGIGTSTPAASLVVQGAAGSNNAINIASSSGATMFSVGANGTTILGSLASDPATATNGATYYNTTSNAFKCYVNSAWQLCDTDGAKMLLKTSDQATTTAVFGNDTQLKFTMAANSTYFVEASIDLDILSVAADAKYTFTIPGGGATINLASLAGITTQNLTVCPIVTSGATCSLAIATVPLRQRVQFHGIVTTSATTGDLQFQFAQGSATAASSSPIVRAGSWMRITNSTNTGGADLAELYYTKSSGLLPGEVVSLDTSIISGVTESTSPYDKNVMGVVSTAPGLVIGLGQDSTDGTYPVQLALAGRVPVKVNTSNGPILPGDYLTSSSIRGEAMKATEPGFVFAQAMTGYDGSDSTDANSSGTVTAFLKQTFYYDPLLFPSLIQILKSASDPNALVSNYTDYQKALTTINDTSLYSYQYGTSTSAVSHIGVAADEVDQGSLNGLFIGSVKALDLKLNDFIASTTASNASTTDIISQFFDFTKTTNDSIKDINDRQDSATRSIDDLNDLASTTSDELSSLELRFASFEASNEIVATSTIDNSYGLGSQIVATLQSFGSKIADGVSYLKNVFAIHLTTQNLTIKGDDVTKTGITIYDRKTKEPLCVYFEDGEMKTDKGACPNSEATSTENIIPLPPISIEPDPIVNASSSDDDNNDATSTIETTPPDIEPAPTPEPEPEPQPESEPVVDPTPTPDPVEVASPESETQASAEESSTPPTPEGSSE